MLSVEGCGLFCVNVFGARNELYHLGAIVVGNREDGVISLRNGEFGDEVQCNCFERESFRFRIYGIEWCLRRTCVDFVSLAFCTSSDVIRSVLLKLGPPIVSLKQSYCPINPRVTVYRGVMM